MIHSFEYTPTQYNSYQNARKLYKIRKLTFKELLKLSFISILDKHQL